MHWQAGSLLIYSECFDHICLNEVLPAKGMRFPMGMIRVCEPLESGHITLSRVAQRAEFPARFQLIAAMNPCPCGYLGSNLRNCRCSSDQVSRYRGKLSGPLLDRIDLHVEVGALAADELINTPPGENTHAIRVRVAAARERAMQRQGSTNQALEGQTIDDPCRLDDAAAKFLNTAAAWHGMAWHGTARHGTARHGTARHGTAGWAGLGWAGLGWAGLGWSGPVRSGPVRSQHPPVPESTHTIADLAGAEKVLMTHVAESVQYRRALKAAH